MSDDTASKKEDFIAVAKEAIEASEQTFSVSWTRFHRDLRDAMPQSGGLDSAVDGLLAAEKKCRLVRPQTCVGIKANCLFRRARHSRQQISVYKL